MALAKQEEVIITVLADGQLQVKKVIIVLEDGKEISRTNRRHVVDVGGDVTNESQIVKDIAGTVHTQARIDARATVRAANNGNGPP